MGIFPIHFLFGASECWRPKILKMRCKHFLLFEHSIQKRMDGGLSNDKLSFVLFWNGFEILRGNPTTTKLEEHKFRRDIPYFIISANGAPLLTTSSTKMFSVRCREAIYLVSCPTINMQHTILHRVHHINFDATNVKCNILHLI